MEGDRLEFGPMQLLRIVLALLLALWETNKT